MALLFGTAGVPKSSPSRDTASGIARVHELGLECMEIEFVRGVRMGMAKAKEVRGVAESLGIALSVHAPYYINLNSPDREKLNASVQRILDSARVGSACGARDVVFHPGYYMKSSRENAYERVKEQLARIVKTLEEESIEVVLRPETTGKRSQLGSLEEVLRLSSELERVLPCVDFAHLYARTRGGANSYEAFAEMLAKVEDALGGEALREMHIHVSGITYNKGGERSHLVLRESRFNYTALLRVLRDYGVEGMLICESPNLEEDALLLKEEYSRV
ncbi:MAG: TIM barrel protein [Euryarchaeota archaeon]|nr:TIM barrel protein [Euryarchaeota archaeon]